MGNVTADMKISRKFGQIADELIARTQQLPHLASDNLVLDYPPATEVLDLHDIDQRAAHLSGDGRPTGAETRTAPWSQIAAWMAASDH
jgi:hypothetical protein